MVGDVIVSGKIVESVVVGGGVLPCGFDGSDGERDGAVVVVAVAVGARGDGEVAPVGSKLK